MKHTKQLWFPAIFLLAGILTGCSLFAAGEEAGGDISTSEPAATQVPPTPTPIPPETLIVCLQDEPESLYLYGAASRSADTILQAIYDGPYDLLDYTFEPVLLEAVPGLEAGVQLNTVIVQNGERYLNPETMLPDMLKYGKPYWPAGCSSPLCQQSYSGGEAQMEQVEVHFRMKEGILWSDGEPVTAADSVFSYELDRHPDTPSSKYVVDRTQIYETTGEYELRWVGIPGFIDPDYGSNFWSPLPEHLLGAEDPAALLNSPQTTLQPVGWGPYVIESWQNQQIVLNSNPQYFRAGEGLPAFDRLVFRFLGNDSDSALQQLVTGECDVLDESLIPTSSIENLLDLQEQGALEFSWAAGSVIERLDFNTAPLNASEARFFGETRTRQAVSMCIDREGLVQTVLNGLGAVPDTYLPSGHPLVDQDVSYPEYDPAAAMALLEQAGWLEVEGDEVKGRVAQGVWNVESGTPFSFTLKTVDGDLQRQVAGKLAEDLAVCGIDVQPSYGSSDGLFTSWPDGEVFSRTFSAVVWAWPVFSSPPCEMYESGQIPSDTSRYGINASGFTNSGFDQACGTVQLSLADSSKAVEAAAATEQLLAEEIPGLPLFERPRVAAYATDICGVDVNPSAFSVLWNLEELHRGDDCGQAE
ncbi:MAG: hypothetical protein JXA25_15175 [Anaerolineales bacterium]|nr:hypothetical protein [Anaerolineales bacterium]